MYSLSLSFPDSPISWTGQILWVPQSPEIWNMGHFAKSKAITRAALWQDSVPMAPVANSSNAGLGQLGTTGILSVSPTEFLKEWYFSKQISRKITSSLIFISFFQFCYLEWQKSHPYIFRSWSKAQNWAFLALSKKRHPISLVANSKQEAISKCTNWWERNIG